MAANIAGAANVAAVRKLRRCMLYMVDMLSKVGKDALMAKYKRAASSL